MRQRKLFPALPQNIQKPLYCPGSCFSFTDFEHLSQRPQPQDSDNLYGNPNGHPSSYWFLLIALLAVFFLLVSYYVIISDCCSDLCHPRSREAQPERPDDSFADENGVDRPISFIPTVGLQLSQINSIKVRRFKKGDGLIEGTDCSVCLNEFLEGEMLRLLPKCGHAFHVSCIDSWLGSHSNCPLCRARIVSDAIAAASTPSYRISDNLDTTTGGGGGGVGREFSSIQRRHSDVAAGTEELHDVTEPKEGLSTCEKEDTFATNRDHNVPYFPRRKSVSLDSSASAALLRGLEDSYDLDFERSFVENDVGNGKSDSQNRPVQDEPSSSSSHQFLRPSPGRTNERSFSCSGRFFTSKRSRNHFLRTP